MFNTNFLVGGGWQQLQIIPLVSDGIGPGVGFDESLGVFPLLMCKCIGWLPLGIPMQPSLQTSGLVVVLQALES